MGADYSFHVKTIETHARAFLPLNISAVGTVIYLLLICPIDLEGITLPTAEILSGKNAWAFLVCGFLMNSFKKKIS